MLSIYHNYYDSLMSHFSRCSPEKLDSAIREIIYNPRPRGRFITNNVLKLREFINHRAAFTKVHLIDR